MSEQTLLKNGSLTLFEAIDSSKTKYFLFANDWIEALEILSAEKIVLKSIQLATVEDFKNIKQPAAKK